MKNWHMIAGTRPKTNTIDRFRSLLCVLLINWGDNNWQNLNLVIFTDQLHPANDEVCQTKEEDKIANQKPAHSQFGSSDNYRYSIFNSELSGW